MADSDEVPPPPLSLSLGGNRVCVNYQYVCRFLGRNARITHRPRGGGIFSPCPPNLGSFEAVVNDTFRDESSNETF